MGRVEEQISGEACGKAILTGEHFVLYGTPALAVPLTEMRTRVRLKVSGEHGLTLSSGGQLLENENALEMVRRAFRLLGCEPSGHVEIDSDIPLGCGLGSSAALGVALVRGLAAHTGQTLEPSRVNDLAFELEKVAHGNPSGVDNTVVTYERGVWFQQGLEPVPLCIQPMTLLIGDTGVRGDTAEAIKTVARWKESHGNLFAEILEAGNREVLELRQALESALWAKAGPWLNRAHERLREVGVSHPALERLRCGALEAGAHGAKLTGAGQGGCVLTLVPSGKEEEVLERMMTEGSRGCWRVQVGGHT
jgi:mevalonate kinase